MLDAILSLHFIAITLIIVLLSGLVALLCGYLHRHLLQVFAGEWLTDHIYCPAVRTSLLVIMTLLLFPIMVEPAGYGDVKALFLTQDYLTNLLNILFVTGLLSSFIPGLRHPALAMPLRACIASAILLQQYYSDSPPETLGWLPDVAGAIKVMVLIILLGWLVSAAIDPVSTAIDHYFLVSGSKLMVSDTLYLIAQTPIMLAYAGNVQKMAY